MTKVYSSPSLMDVDLRRILLVDNDIVAVIQNEHMTVTGLNVGLNVWPELWVVHDKDVQRAQELLALEDQN